MAPSEDVSDNLEEGITEKFDHNETMEQDIDAKKDQTGNNAASDNIANETFAPEQDDEDETAAPTETSTLTTTPAPSSVATSNTPTADDDDDDDDDDDMEEEETPPKFYVTQRVYGRDEPTGLLYEAVVRRIMRGPRSRQINVHLLSKEEAERLQENNDKHKNGEAGATSSADVDLGFVLDDFDEGKESTQCWHYFVHYMGWNVRWDRWVEEDYLYEDSPGTKILADKLKAEMRKMKEGKRKGKTKKKMKDEEVTALRRRMRQLEEERREEERKEQLALSRGEGEGDGVAKNEDGENADEKTKDGADPNENSKANDESKETSEGAEETDKQTKTESSSKPENEKEDPKNENTTKKTKEKRLGPMRMSKKAIEREIDLRERDLESRRNQAYAEKIVLPFTLKKVMVEEWEIISQCGMVPDLPASVTVMDALNLYLESKIDMLRLKEKKGAVVSESGEEEQQNTGEGVKEENEVDTKEGKSVKDNKDIKGKQEWVDMVEGLALYFDQSLPTRLLFRQELRQYAALVRSSAKGDPTFSDKCMSEIYGCEHLLRLFVRLPALIAESSLPEMETRKIYAKIGDLVRFMQKHQAEFFTQSYRKPRQNEIWTKQDVGRVRKKASVGKRGEEESAKTRVKKRVSLPTSEKDTEESDGSLSESAEQNRDEIVGKKQSDKKIKSLRKTATVDDDMASGSKRRHKKDISPISSEEFEEGRGKKRVSSGTTSTRTIDRRRTKRTRTTKDSTSTEVVTTTPKANDNDDETNVSKNRHKMECHASDSTEADEKGRGKKQHAGSVKGTRTSDRQRAKKSLTGIDDGPDPKKRTRRAAKTPMELNKREVSKRRTRE